ncbi:hypothetical protein AB0M28_30420 [Streptomyces sp. NPDC051940]|uniref:hypothetical protein n=1 Tax=Streptomyces sp. NPDC051940 TaxID=3155675 RepID=UPI00343EF47F
MKRSLATGAVCAAVLLSLAACSDDDESPAEKATKAAGELCTDLTQMKSDVAALGALDAKTATKDQIKTATDAVQEDWDDIKDNLGDLASAKKDALSDATGDLKSSYDDLSGDTTGEEARTELQPQITKLQETVDAASTGLKC